MSRSASRERPCAPPHWRRRPHAKAVWHHCYGTPGSLAPQGAQDDPGRRCALTLTYCRRSLARLGFFNPGDTEGTGMISSVALAVLFYISALTWRGEFEQGRSARVNSYAANTNLKSPTGRVHSPSSVVFSSALERCVRHLKRGRVAHYMAMRIMKTPAHTWARHISRHGASSDVVATVVVGGTRQPIRCAAIGSSPSLLLAQHGPEIDAHDIVLRFNFAPTTGHESSVGSITHLRMMAQLYVPANRTDGSVVIHRYQSREREQEDALTVGNYSIVAVNSWPTSHIGTRRRYWYPSSGIAGVILLLRICTNVSLYGFDTTGSHPGHYYDEEKEGLLINLRQLIHDEPWRTRLAPHSLYMPGGVLKRRRHSPATPLHIAERRASSRDKRYILSNDNELNAPGALNQFIRKSYAAMNDSVKSHNMQLERVVLREWIHAGCLRASYT